MLSRFVQKIKRFFSRLTRSGWAVLSLSVIVVAASGYYAFSFFDNNSSNTNNVARIISGPIPLEALNPDEPISATNPQVAKDTLIVEIPQAKDKAQFGNNLKPIATIPNMYELKVEGKGSIQEKQANVAKLPGIVNAEPEIYNNLPFPQSENLDYYRDKAITAYGAQQWHMANINADQAKQVTKGRGVLVAVIDDGINKDHESFKSALDTNNAIDVTTPGQITYINGEGEEKTCTNVNDWSSGGSHGTQVASVLASRKTSIVQFEGVAPEAIIMPIKSGSCTGLSGVDIAVAKAIAHATDRGARVINLSTASYPILPLTDESPCSNILISAVNYALSKNVVLVASSGNGNLVNADGNPTTSMICPARIPGVIAVGASNRQSQLIAQPTDDYNSSFGPNQSVIAPGLDTVAACSCFASGLTPKNNVYNFEFGGTSGAAPHVSGVAALILSANPGLSGVQVKSIIEGTARGAGHNNRTGYGLVNAKAAIDVAR